MIDSRGSEKADSYDHYITNRENPEDELRPTDDEPADLNDVDNDPDYGEPEPDDFLD